MAASKRLILTTALVLVAAGGGAVAGQLVQKQAKADAVKWADEDPGYHPVIPHDGRTAPIPAVSFGVKGDRKADARIEPSAVVTHVEIVGGAADAKIILLDPDGNVVYESDPETNTTTIAKDVVIPSITVRKAPGDTAQLKIVTAAAPVHTPEALIQELGHPNGPKPAGVFYRTDM